MGLLVKLRLRLQSVTLRLDALFHVAAAVVRRLGTFVSFPINGSIIFHSAFLPGECITCLRQAHKHTTTTTSSQPKQKKS